MRLAFGRGGKLDLRVIGFYTIFMLIMFALVAGAATSYFSARITQSVSDSVSYGVSQIKTRYEDDILAAVDRYMADNLVFGGPAQRNFFTSEDGGGGITPLQIYTQLQSFTNRERPIKSAYVYSYANDTLVSSNEGVYFNFGKSDNPYQRYYSISRFDQAADRTASPWGAYDIFENGQSAPSYRYALKIGGKPVGMLVVNVDYTAYDRIVSPIVTPLGGFFAILDESGNTLFSGANSPRIPEGSLFFGGGASGFAFVDIEGARHAVAWAASDRGGWNYAVIMPMQVYLQPVRRFYATVFISAVALVLVVTGLSAFVGTRLFRPFNALVSRLGGMSALAHGDDVALIDHAFRNISGELAQARETLKRDEALREQRFLFDIIADNLPNEAEAESRMASLSVNFRHPQYVLFIVNFPSKGFEPLDAAYMEGFLSVALDAAKAYLSGPACSVMGMPISKNELLCLANVKDAGGMPRRLNDLMEHMRLRLGVEPCIAASSPASSAALLTGRYGEAREAMKYSFIHPQGRVFTPENTSSQARAMLTIPIASLDSIEAHLRAGRAAEAYAEATAYIETARRENASYESVSISISSIISTLIRIESEHREVDKSERRALSEGFMKANNVDEYMEWLGDVLNAFEWNEGGRKDAAHTSYMDRVKQYIAQNIEGDVSQSAVAAVFKISTGHLSRLFKEWTGEQYHAYVTAQKLERAERLLAETSVDVSEIAARLGYFQPAYFSKLFKGQTGVTPVQYRKAAQSGARVSGVQDM